MSEASRRSMSVVPVFIVLGILVLFSVIFIIEMIHLSEQPQGVAEDGLTAETYMEIVTPLLVGADPQRGAQIVVERGCSACHAGSGAGNLAPGFAGLAAVAAQRHLPLQAEAYLYESIVYPGAFLVEGYQNNMPRLYGEQIAPEDIGHLIAYLLSGQADN